MVDADPQREYARRLTLHRAARDGFALRSLRLSNARGAVGVAGLVLAWLAFASNTVLPGWLALPIGAFLALMAVHDRIINAQALAARKMALYEAGLARVEDRWMGHGAAGERFRDASHPYAEDLDVFGRASLFERLSLARTEAGVDTLARWLLAPASASEVRERQDAVAELRLLVDLREDVALLGGEIRERVAAPALVAWGAAPSPPDLAVARGVTLAATLLTAAGVVWSALGAGLGPAALGFAFQGVALAWIRRRGVRAVPGVDRAARDLEVLGRLLARIESNRFQSARLVALRQALDSEGQPPSRRIASLVQRLDLYDARRNQLFMPIALVLMWSTNLSLAIEAWRAHHGGALARWVAVAGEWEALLSLAAYAYERPEDPFPEVVEDGVCFEAVGLGHPLLPAARLVRNDLRLDAALSLLVVSGSNMSGKSTLLRAAGSNAVLALMGAPVCARSLRLSPLALGASIRLHDSLEEGTSRFYAEIRRLARIVELVSGPLPLLFLLDEILAGTNSHDRRIGAEAVARNLVDRGAVGLLTTHDLALAHIAESLAPRAANVHFEDRIEDGRMVFDYRMREGVVERSNALELMRSIGLPV